jgi:hypothetical protein
MLIENPVLKHYAALCTKNTSAADEQFFRLLIADIMDNATARNISLFKASITAKTAALHMLIEGFIRRICHQSVRADAHHYHLASIRCRS